MPISLGHMLTVTNLSIQRGPSTESVTRTVEIFSQRVLSSPPFLCRCSIKRRRVCNTFIPNKHDSLTGDTERTRKRFLTIKLPMNLTQEVETPQIPKDSVECK